jgi:hypothetical protein
VDGLDEGAAAFGERDEGDFSEQGGEAADVVFALGAVDHGGVEHETRAAGGEEGALAGEHAVAVRIWPVCEFPCAAEKDEAGGGRGGGEDGGGMAGVGAGDDFFRVAQGGFEGIGIGEVGDAGRAWEPGCGPARGAADDRDDRRAIIGQRAAERGAGSP